MFPPTTTRVESPHEQRTAVTARSPTPVRSLALAAIPLLVVAVVSYPVASVLTLTSVVAVTAFAGVVRRS